jgi:hypothetical protein
LKYLIWALSGLLVVGGVFWLSGLLLPPKHEASATLRLKATPEAVWAVLAAVDNYPLWRSDLATLEIIGRKPELSWTETARRGGTAWHEAGPGRIGEKWIDKLVKGNPPLSGERVFLLVAEADGGTRVALTECLSLPDPLARFRARFVTGYAENLRTLLGDLRKRLAE